MEVSATMKYVKISPSKARDLARAIQGLAVPRALEVTSANTRKAAFLIGKTLKSAIANAENNGGLAADELYVGQARIEDGPAQGRFQPVARGMAHPIRKRTSHIKIVLTDQQPGGK